MATKLPLPPAGGGGGGGWRGWRRRRWRRIRHDVRWIGGRRGRWRRRWRRRAGVPARAAPAVREAAAGSTTGGPRRAWPVPISRRGAAGAAAARITRRAAPATGAARSCRPSGARPDGLGAPSRVAWPRGFATTVARRRRGAATATGAASATGSGRVPSAVRTARTTSRMSAARIDAATPSRRARVRVLADAPGALAPPLRRDAPAPAPAEHVAAARRVPRLGCPPRLAVPVAGAARRLRRRWRRRVPRPVAPRCPARRVAVRRARAGGDLAPIDAEARPRLGDRLAAQRLEGSDRRPDPVRRARFGHRLAAEDAAVAGREVRVEPAARRRCA